MISWRGLLCVALAAVSIDTPTVRSQPAADSDDDDAGSAGSAATGSHSGSGAVVLPADPKLRLEWLKAKLVTAITSRPTLARAKIGYAVQDLASGAELAVRDGDTKLNLASNAKVLTAMAALSGLGGGFRWRTSVYVEQLPDETGLVKGDLFVRGRGDPLLSIAQLRQLAADVAARGVRTVEGQLVVDATYFDAHLEPPHFDEQPKERAAFRAPVASFGVNRNTVTVTVMAEPGGGARVTIDPATEYTKLTKDEVTSVATGRTRLRLEQKPKKDHVELELTGQIRAGEGSWDLRRRVDDPTRFAALIFQRELAAQGIKIGKPQLAFATVPQTAKQIAHHDSAPLADVIRFMNKSSDNYIAESILKTLGAELKGTPGPAAWTDGLAAEGRELAKHGLALGTYRAGNGSGLYAATEVTPRQLVTLFARAHGDYRLGPDLVASLPTGGFDGTLARRWIGKAPAGRVRAKTGTLDKVVTLGGYVGVSGNHLLAFSILVNDIPPGQRPTVRALMDEMVELMVAYLAPL